jgi:tetratricopeptide (TPR) repeat protein
MNQDNGKFSRENRSVEHGDSDDWCEKADALCKLDRWEEALQAYDKALELNPNDSKTWDNKGDALGRGRRLIWKQP